MTRPPLTHQHHGVAKHRAIAGAGVNYWLNRRWALRSEFKGYPGGQDLGGFAEFRFGLSSRP